MLRWDSYRPCLLATVCQYYVVRPHDMFFASDTNTGIARRRFRVELESLHLQTDVLQHGTSSTFRYNRETRAPHPTQRSAPGARALLPARFAGEPRLLQCSENTAGGSAAQCHPPPRSGSTALLEITPGSRFSPGLRFPCTTGIAA